MRLWITKLLMSNVVSRSAICFQEYLSPRYQYLAVNLIEVRQLNVFVMFILNYCSFDVDNSPLIESINLKSCTFLKMSPYCYQLCTMFKYWLAFASYHLVLVHLKITKLFWYGAKKIGVASRRAHAWFFICSHTCPINTYS
jgi:hypothetical protein